MVWTLSKVASRVGDPRKPRAVETQAESSSEADYARDRSLARETNKRATLLYEQVKGLHCFLSCLDTTVGLPKRRDRKVNDS